MNDPILFYSHKKEHGYFSNFYGLEQDSKFTLILPTNMDYAGLDVCEFDPSDVSGLEAARGFKVKLYDYTTSEHPYQIQKFNKRSGSTYRKIMQYLVSPSDVAAFGRKRFLNRRCTMLYDDAPDDIKKYGDIKPYDVIQSFDKVKLRRDWEMVKDDIMYFVVFNKFAQNEHLKKLLVGTTDHALVEHTRVDRYWADGGDGSGKNMLGKILMKVRDDIV